MWRRTFLKIKEFVTQNLVPAMEAKTGDKRGADGAKKFAQAHQEVKEDRKRKVALLIAYNGKGYYGLQLNPGFPTIESEVIKALLQVEVIPQDHHDTPHKMAFQRAARTDKGVSAAGNVLSLKMQLNVENLLDKINENLPAQIRAMDCIRTTKHFNAKNHCSARTYVYLIPTYAFAPIEETVNLEYRTNYDIIEKVNEVLEMFIGTHNFHNFTSGIKPTEGTAKRYIKQFECRLPFVKDGVEFCVLSVTGQSFMMHQIRKMVGLTIAVVKGYAKMGAIEQAWQHEKMDIPKAPGLGLVLEKLHYDQYNKRFGDDGVHDKVEFSHIKEKLDKFKEDFIFSDIIKTEKEEQSMMEWLSTLHLHTCLPAQSDPGTAARRMHLKALQKDRQQSEADGEQDTEHACSDKAIHTPVETLTDVKSDKTESQSGSDNLCEKLGSSQRQETSGSGDHVTGSSGESLETETKLTNENEAVGHVTESGDTEEVTVDQSGLSSTVIEEMAEEQTEDSSTSEKQKIKQSNAA